MESVYQQIIKQVPTMTGLTKEEVIVASLDAPIVFCGEYLALSAPDTNVIIEPSDDEYLLTGHPAIAGGGKLVGEEEMLKVVGWDGVRAVPENNAAAALYAERRASMRSGWLSSR